jgi:hypothetical protein
MNRFLSRVFARALKFRKSGPSARSNRQSRLTVEVLEERQVPSNFPITDMTVLAQQYPTHDGPTNLYLNFDGWHDQNHNIGAFTTPQRDQDIQDILYRASEVFAPFNVEVQRAFGDSIHGESNGDTTIFVGDIAGAKGPYAFTPSSSADYPGPVRGIFHQPNSDPFDVAYVDPFLNGSVVWTNTQIASAAAHEAGHTFGLAHVRTSGMDPQPLDYSNTFPDVMSYDSPNIRFMNQTFAVTEFNYNGSQTVLDPNLMPMSDYELPGSGVSIPYPILTQNSYTYLQAVLGPRPVDDHANVTHWWSVDSSYTDGPLLAVSAQSSVAGTIERSGDYDVFQFTPTKDQTLAVQVVATGHPLGGLLDPVLLIYEGQGLDAFNNDVSSTNHNSYVSYAFQAGHTYSLVVGAADGGSVGPYNLVVGNFRVIPPTPTGDVTLIDPNKLTKPPFWIDPSDPPPEGIFDGLQTHRLSTPVLFAPAVDAVLGDLGAPVAVTGAIPQAHGALHAHRPHGRKHGPDRHSGEKGGRAAVHHKHRSREKGARTHHRAALEAAFADGPFSRSGPPSLL